MEVLWKSFSLSFSTVVASVTHRQTDKLTFGLLGLLSQPKIFPLLGLHLAKIGRLILVSRKL